jgi:hypothetical protein
VDTKHPDEGTLYGYVEGQLPVAEAARVDAHVAGCAECASLVAEARGLIAAASGIIGALDNVPANVVPPRRVRPLPQWLAAAAVVVLAAGVSTVAIRSRVDTGREMATTAVDAGAGVSSPAALEQRAADGPGNVDAVASPAAPEVRVRSSAAGAGDMSESRRSAVSAPPNTVTEKAASQEDVAAFSGVAETPLAAPLAAAPTPANTRTAGPGAGARREAAVAPTGRVAARAPAAAQGDVDPLSFSRQETTVTGRVMAEGGRPLAGANVFINELSVSVGTDASGTYELTIPSNRLQGRAAVVRARAIGYASQTREVTVAEGTQTADFELKREAAQASEIAVTGSSTDDASLTRAAELPTPIRTIRYEVSRGVVVELREFHGLEAGSAAQPGVNEYHWSNPAGTRRYVLSGRIPVTELERLASRLGELRVIR